MTPQELEAIATVFHARIEQIHAAAVDAATARTRRQQRIALQYIEAISNPEAISALATFARLNLEGEHS